MRREMTLADRFMQPVRRRTDWAPQAYVDRLRNKVRQAHRFTLDSDAVDLLCRVCGSVPDLIIREDQFARAPFDLTWIEAPCDSGMQVGHLIEHNRVTAIAGFDPPAIDWVETYLHTEWPTDERDELLRIFDTSRRGLDHSLWSTPTAVSDNMLGMLSERHLMQFRPGGREMYEDFRKKYPTDARGIAGFITKGSLHQLLTTLLLLNRPTITRFENKPAGRAWFGNRHLPYLSHSVVHLTFNARETVKLLGTLDDEASPKRRHEVRGHYCHDWRCRSSGCAHVFVVEPHEGDDPDWPSHWQCKVCRGRRWWRKAHMRGDASVGFVTKDYSVTGE